MFGFHGEERRRNGGRPRGHGHPMRGGLRGHMLMAMRDGEGRGSEGRRFASEDFDAFGFDRDGGPRGGRGDHGGRGGRGGHGGGRRRVLGGPELRLLLLKLIADEPRHGYDLIRAVEELTGNSYAPSPGIVYPTLTLLTDMGLIAGTDSDGPRKTFAVTQAGTAELAENAEMVTAIVARLSQLASAGQPRNDPTALRRAVMNLRVALHNRLDAETLSKDQILDLAMIIDDAARAVERY